MKLEFGAEYFWPWAAQLASVQMQAQYVVVIKTPLKQFFFSFKTLHELWYWITRAICKCQNQRLNILSIQLSLPLHYNKCRCIDLEKKSKLLRSDYNTWGENAKFLFYTVGSIAFFLNVNKN